MEKTMARSIVAVILLAAVLFGAVFAPNGVAAASSDIIEFDYTDILDDLEGSTDGEGNTFDIANYPKDENGSVRLYTFIEYGYSYAANRRGNYGLYVYLYNPTESAIDTSSPLNRIQMAVEWGADGAATDYDKFELRFCAKTTGDYANRFYKFKIVDHEGADGKTIAKRVQASERRYDISGVEVVDKATGNVREYGVGGIYKYSGYAAGYGATEEGDSTLRVTLAPMETVDLDVQSTYYRYPTTTDTATQLVSAYFAIDNTLIEKYGKLYAILAEWWEYELAPMIVVDNAGLYEELSDWVGKDLNGGNSSVIVFTWDEHKSGTYFADWYYGDGHGVSIMGPDVNLPGAEQDTLLANLFYTGGEADAREYVVTSEEIEQHMQEYTAAHGSGSAYKGYNDDLFVGGAGYTKIEKTADDLFDLAGFDMGSGFLNWWYDFIFGYDNPTIEGIEPIHAVTASDLASADIANDLLIAESDVDAFRTYCNAQMNAGKTVYLFRYATSVYKEKEAIAKPTGISWIGDAVYDQSVRNETVYLGFDIITLTFKGEDGTLTVLPVVADPIDVIPDSGGMQEILEQANPGGPKWWIYLAIAVAAVVLVLVIVKAGSALFAARTVRRKTRK